MTKLIYFIVILLLCVNCKQEKVGLNSELPIIGFENESISYKNGTKVNWDPNSYDQLFYLVRHAEKDTTVKGDAPLTDYGFERSYMLADVFRKIRVDEIYSSLRNRTVMTVDSISRMKGMSIKIYDTKKLDSFAIELRSDPTLKSVLISGHSNTTPELASHLADRPKADAGKIGHDEYDAIYIVGIKEGQNDLFKLKYDSPEE